MHYSKIWQLLRTGGGGGGGGSTEQPEKSRESFQLLPPSASRWKDGLQKSTFALNHFAISRRDLVRCKETGASIVNPHGSRTVYLTCHTCQGGSVGWLAGLNECKMDSAANVKTVQITTEYMAE